MTQPYLAKAASLKAWSEGLSPAKMSPTSSIHTKIVIILSIAWSRD